MRISPVMRVYFLVLAAVIAMVVFLALSIGGSTVPLFDESVSDYNQGWRYADERGQQQPLTLPASISWPAGTELVLTHTVPEDVVEGTTLCLRSSQQSLRVMVDGVEVYRYGLDGGAIHGQSPGSAYHLVPLSPENRGKTLTVVLRSAYGRFAGVVNTALIGSKTACIHAIIRWGLPNLMLCAGICLMGLIMMGIYLAASFGGKRYPALLYLGVFAVVISLWSACETRMLQLFAVPPALERHLAFLALMLCPIPMLQFVREVYRPRFIPVYHGLSWLCLATACLCMALQLTGTADYIQTLPLVHGVIFLCVVFVTVSAFLEMARFKNPHGVFYASSISLLAVFSLMDLFRFYRGTLADSAFFFRIGLALYVLILGGYSIRSILRAMELGQRSRELTRLAYTDGLTQVMNRTAFEEALMGARTGEEAMAIFDINCFKQVNDRYGHQAGDELLCQAAHCIQRAFGPYGSCYRIGGDEFAVLLPRCTAAAMEEYLESLRELERRYNAGRPEGPVLDMACGGAYAAGDMQHTLRELYARADAAMYLDKKQAKQA